MGLVGSIDDDAFVGGVTSHQVSIVVEAGDPPANCPEVSSIFDSHISKFSFVRLSSAVASSSRDHRKLFTASS